MMGPLALVIVGIVALAPVMARGFLSIAEPIYRAFSIDPAALVNTILALDMGGYALAEELALSEEASVFSWALIGTTYGPTVAFTVPLASFPSQTCHFLQKGYCSVSLRPPRLFAWRGCCLDFP